MPDYILYTDGGSRGNPGPAGSGAYITDGSGKMLKEATQFLGNTTNNVAEWNAVVLALETLKKIVPKDKRKKVQVEIRMDSELVAKQIRGEYQMKHPTLFPYFIAVWNMRVAEFPHMTIVHIPREKNKEADRLSNVAMDQGN